MTTMTDQASHPSQRSTSHILEEKLKSHIQREFDLGEKVISLLKQKNQLESNLEEQLTSKQQLENQLAETIASKHNLEQEYAVVQKELRTQQKTLRQRSRRFSVTEEDSREDLRALNEELHRLKEQLDLLDSQKVEEHVQLSNTIQKLTHKERQLQQELQKISYQKEIAEEELEHTAQRLHEMAGTHEHEQQQHEQEIDRLQRQQAHMEIRIAHLLDEQQRNERSLQQQIESLKQSKAQLEEKVAQLRQQHPEHDEEAEKELLQVIERQEHVIQQLKEQAHQRSTMLRAENETLKQKVQSMLTNQEKIHWENQMLESSLKSLQHDLAEYLLLKNRFEEAQREKEHFEEAFYRKIRFLEERYMTAESSTPDHPEEAVHVHHQPINSMTAVSTKTAPPANEASTPLRQEHPGALDEAFEEKTEKIPLRSWKTVWSKILISVGAVLILLLSAAITVELLNVFKKGDIPTTTTEAPVNGYELPEDKFGLNRSREELFREGSDPLFPASEPAQIPATPEAPKNSRTHSPSAPTVPLQSPVAGTTAPQHPPASEPAQKNRRSQAGARVQPPQQAGTILVQLSPEESAHFLPKEQQPYPTAENNVVLRRYYKQKHPDSQHN